MAEEILSSKNDVLIMTGSDIVKAAVEKYSREYKTLLVIDFSGLDEAEKAEYLSSVNAAQVVTEEQIKSVLEKGAVLIAVPFYTISFAAEAYRRIKHARHFVTLWTDGKKYEMEG